jgi:hypothetical protein
MHMDYSWFRLSILSALGLSACATRSGFDELGDDAGSSSSVGDGDGDGNGDGDGDTVEPIDPTLCEDPEPIMQAGTEIPSGFVRCADGFVHRLEAVACEAPASVGSCQFPTPDFGCTADADCVDGPFGACNDGVDGYCWCNYGCETDADCQEGTICACAGVVGAGSRCVYANCPLSTACNEGLCGLETWTNVCGEIQGVLACTTEASTCRVDETCGELECELETETEPLRCAAYLGWNCQTEADVWCDDYCGEGRPFIVDGEVRIAQPCRRDDWSTPRSSFGDDDLREDVRVALASYWSRVGLFEHASVASFARFGLQLLAAGAPPKLLAATRRATLDEIEHARLAFALASRFAGHPVGPGALAVAGALHGSGDLRGIIRGLIEEACVGETVAAIEARHAAALATDAHVAMVLEQIASDELRHAQLGWRALRWMLERADVSLRRFALECLDQAILAASRSVARELESDELELEEFGVLSSSTRAQVRAAAIREVLRPCAAGLRAGASASAELQLRRAQLRRAQLSS